MTVGEADGATSPSPSTEDDDDDDDDDAWFGVAGKKAADAGELRLVSEEEEVEEVDSGVHAVCD